MARPRQAKPKRNEPAAPPEQPPALPAGEEDRRRVRRAAFWREFLPAVEATDESVLVVAMLADGTAIAVPFESEHELDDADELGAEIMDVASAHREGARID